MSKKREQERKCPLPTEPLDRPTKECSEWPVVFIESTEYTASSPIVLPTEKEDVYFATQMAQFPASEILRFRVPWSLASTLGRYICITTAVAWQTLDNCRAREFVLGLLFPGGSAPRHRGAPRSKMSVSQDTKHLSSSESHSSSSSATLPSTNTRFCVGIDCARLLHGVREEEKEDQEIAFFPAYVPTKDEVEKDAMAVFDYLPPIPALGDPIVPAKEEKQSGEQKDRGHFVSCRKQDWLRHEQAIRAHLTTRLPDWKILSIREYESFRGAVDVEILLGVPPRSL